MSAGVSPRIRQRDIRVYADWLGLDTPKLVGILSATPARGKEIFSFEYDRPWLSSNMTAHLDPDLQLFGGPQHLTDKDKTNFGLFLDSSPDRWGRVLMRRREAALARSQRRPEVPLLESDYLLGVYDRYRMGGLRFKLTETGNFLDDNEELACPPWTSLRALEQASFQLESNANDDPVTLKWLNMLISPGASLGGARPKASIADPKGNLWIAKFPSRQDTCDVGAWERVVNELAVQAGLNVAESMTQALSKPYRTYLTKRFDRKKNHRIHFASAMTLLGHHDGDGHDTGVSYLELAEFLMQHGAQTDQDLEELWRRIVFYIGVSNADDHLRNHGFLLTGRGWVLSPAYDINPVPTAHGLSLNINENDNALAVDLAMEVIPFFRLSPKRANAIVAKIRKATSTWRAAAARNKISASEQERMSKAFRVMS